LWISSEDTFPTICKLCPKCQLPVVVVAIIEKKKIGNYRAVQWGTSPDYLIRHRVMTRENACLTSTTQIGPKRNGSSVVDRWVDKTGKRATVIGDSVCRATVASEHANSPGVKDSDKTDCAVAVDRRGREKTGEHPAGICNGR